MDIDNIDLNQDDIGIIPIAIPANNFGLTLEMFNDMVVKLKNGNEELFEKVFLSQFSETMNYLKFNYKVLHDNAYDLTMNTLLEFRKKLLTDKITYGNLRYLFTKMATQFYLKSKAKSVRQEEANRYSIFDEDEDDMENRIIALKDAWHELPDSDKQILEDYYYNEVPLIKIAERENKTDATIRKQKQRSADRLRLIFFKKYDTTNN